ncbi:MAG TPA: lytic transglycosylase domain-containing protein [Solirubrobacteraceae bacterium]|nr:lytic transglycosylase domain-containing protein [Solirubrobacteraceae bacterium]
MRLRPLALVLFAVLVVGAVALVAPMIDRAVREVTLPLRHEDIIRQQARDKGLDPALVAAVIYAESKFRDQTSSTGAKGLMQIQPETAKFIAQRSGGTRFEIADLGTPQINIQYGTWYLRYLLGQHDGNVVLAVASYNAGETNVARWVERSRHAGQEFRIGDIPFPETRAYVQRVLDAERDYRREYASELGL